ncbi:MAG: hypothetical protein IT450_16565 [Phycisphaerales bacterium]|nr:hypothetical protein [Phycisphaerales bacterium]
MTPREIITRVAAALERERVPYMLTGALASIPYGITRTTKDMDVVVALNSDAIGDLVKRLGPEFRLEPQVQFESVTGTTYFRIRPERSRFYVEVFLVSADEFDQERFQRRTRVSVFGNPISVATPEDVVIQKLRWWKLAARPKDHADAAEVVSVLAKELDWDYIRRWCTVHGTLDEAERLRAAAPP